MNRNGLKLLGVLAFVAIAVLFWYGVSGAQDDWPREIATQEGKITVYQPQLESFKGDIVSARAALSILKKDAKEPIFGVAWFSARALTNRDTRLVEFTDLKIERVKFPFATKDQEKALSDFLTKDVNNWERTPMALDRFLAEIATIEKEKAAADQLSTDPPKIIFTKVPSALISINGKPELRKVENSDLERVINTPFAILYAPSTQTYYLKGGDFWYSTLDVMGPWKTIPNPPPSVLEVVKRASQKEDTSEASQDQAKPKTPPQIIVATVPTELIVSDGEPKFESVQGTGLLDMSNTPSEVFMEVKTQQYYVLLAGRWYRSGSLEKGPWTYVAAEKLPSDFMKIPPGSAKGHILAFVGGTTQAQEAVLDAQIPQTAAIKRSEAKLNVTYDGEPKFEKVKGTSMDYAVNTGTQVLKIQGKYYACDQAVWFVSDNSNGPWVVADSIPSEIDTIPPESPVYNVKYVHVYDSTPDVVYTATPPDTLVPTFMGTPSFTGQVMVILDGRALTIIPGPSPGDLLRFMIPSIAAGVLDGVLAPDSSQALAGVLAGAGVAVGAGAGAPAGAVGGTVGAGAVGITGVRMGIHTAIRTATRILTTTETSPDRSI